MSAPIVPKTDAPYWHETFKSLDEIKAWQETLPDNYTIGDMMRDYKQPEWCQLAGALEGSAGCWGLWDGYVAVKGRDYCKTCEYAAPVARLGEK